MYGIFTYRDEWLIFMVFMVDTYTIPIEEHRNGTSEMRPWSPATMPDNKSMLAAMTCQVEQHPKT